jgi:hypothetical protein
MRVVQRETARLQSMAAAEAAVQSAMAQVGQNAYTGFINTAAISVGTFQSTTGTSIGSFSANIQYPDQADWVIVTGTGTVNGETRSIEARIFLESNLSKYLVYAIDPSFGSGNNAQYGESDGVNPEGVSSNEYERAAMYFTGDWAVTGSNVHLYGDAHAEDEINGNSSSKVHGDTYVKTYTTDQYGNVTNTGVTGGLLVGDGFTDDSDRNQDGVVNADDKPDYHDLTAQGDDDSHATETLTAIDHNFYSTNNSIPAFGTTTANRYLEFRKSGTGNTTEVVQYTSSTFTTVTATYTLPQSAIVYVNGDAFVKGEIEGRVSVVASDDIHLMGNVTYTNGQKYADPTHSSGFMAKDKIYFKPNELEVSGILYGERSSNAATVFDSDYDTAGVYNPGVKSDLKLYGNRVMVGDTNLSNYDSRVYGYDPNLKYYRPPGIPVRPEVRTVREVLS